MMNKHGDEGASPASLEIAQTQDPDGYVRVKVRGELDLGSSETFVARLRQLKREGRNVRLDFSELSFMDSTGLAILIPALGDASQDGWVLDVDRNLAEQVKKLFDLTGLGQRIWPGG